MGMTPGQGGKLMPESYLSFGEETLFCRHNDAEPVRSTMSVPGYGNPIDSEMSECGRLLRIGKTGDSEWTSS